MIRRAARPDEAGVRQNEIVKTIWTGRMAQAAGKYGEHAPMATVCCNTCRTCVTTNIVGLLMAALAFVGLGARRLIPGFGDRRRAASTE